MNELKIPNVHFQNQFDRMENDANKPQQRFKRILFLVNFSI